MDLVLRALDAVAAGTMARKCENERLDFKEAKPDFKEACSDLAEAAVCFANAGGGFIVVGVVDSKAGHEAFVGCELDPGVLRGRIHQLTSPNLLVEVTALEFSGARLLIIAVPAGLDVYSTTKGYAYQRINDQCVPMRPLDISRLTEERRGIDWSATSSGRSIEEVDPLALRYCRRLLQNSSDATRQSYGRLSDIDLFRVLKVVADDGSLNRAGELLLCENSTSTLLDLAVYQHRRTQAGEADAIVRMQSPMVLAFEEVLQSIRARQGITPVTLADGQQIQIEDYPSAAVREAIANAFIHGDWRLRSPIQVDHSSEYLRITSPGPLVNGITVNNILTMGSRARYPTLASAFRLLGLAEEVGQGVDRMFREMIKSGREAPTIVEDRDQVAVAFRGQPPNTKIARFLATLPIEEQEDTDALLIIRALCRKRTVDASEIAPVIQRSADEAQASLLRLSTSPVDILEPTRGTMRRTFPSYRLRGEVVSRLGAAVSYHSRAIDEIDRKVIEHIRDYGEVNSRTIQRLFDVDVYQARDILRDLVGREIITRTSEQSRGTAVRYGPGPAFPAKKGRSKTPRKAKPSPENNEMF
ncbi:RNA-binding domain-containing protein [Planobispora takensis]|uniref:Transcriptional regulator n=1 Tax=Planobispora takensis TaxID=1367882 RepID=A0A8J3WTW5_9ACTN|nr:RNA-binding domain-containing protein [Planobispora takensis]GII02304.1 transcriptional regulator [Planobispora takensis]